METVSKDLRKNAMMAILIMMMAVLPIAKSRLDITVKIKELGILINAHVKIIILRFYYF